ncbi:MAG: hypothetical protein AAGB51_08025 [Planctomycetota bacterium]
MTGPVCYLGRTDHGDTIVEARLFVAGGESSWTPPQDPEGADNEGDDSLGQDPIETPRALAAWLAERLGDSGSLGSLVLDTEGSLCAWADRESATPRMLPAMVGGFADDENTTGPAALSTLLGPDHELPGAATLTAFAGDEADAPRVAVASIEDAPARVLIDELDAQGLHAREVISVWEAMARVWDPGSPGAVGGREGGAIVADSACVAAVVLVEPEGRAVWTWSLRGELLCAGTIRVPSNTDGVPEFADEQAARLAADWIAWSAELGRGPERVVWIGEQTPPMTVVSKAWPAATVDALELDDPVAATLERVVAGAAPQTHLGPLAALSERPGRSHRKAFRWAAALMAAAGVLFGVWGIRASGAAKETQERRDEVLGGWTARVSEVEPSAVELNAGVTILNLRAVHEELTGAPAEPTEVAELKDVMIELENISLVVSQIEDLELRDLRVDQITGNLSVTVPGIQEFEALQEAFEFIGSKLNWSAPQGPQREGERIRATFQGNWIEPDEQGGGA